MDNFYNKGRTTLKTQWLLRRYHQTSPKMAPKICFPSVHYILVYLRRDVDKFQSQRQSQHIEKGGYKTPPFEDCHHGLLGCPRRQVRGAEGTE